MPIVDVELVSESEAEFSAISAEMLANALGVALGSQPGHTWVRLRYLNNTCYAENLAARSQVELPVFVTVLLAHPPVQLALAEQVAAVTQAVANAVGRCREVVHVQYAPAAAGRQAFGGELVQ